MTDKKKSSRELALDILLEILEKGDFSHTLLNKTLKMQNTLTKQDRSFITRLVEGTLERLLTLDYILNSYSKVRVEKMKPFIRNLLRMSLYQLKYMDQVPDSAVCNEAVKMAEKRGFKSLSGFVNGVLRNIARDSRGDILPGEEKDREEYLSILYSTPKWMIEKWLKEYDYETVKKMLTAQFEEKKHTTIRVNLAKNTAGELADRLREDSIEVKEGSYLDCALKIQGFESLDSIKAFKEGRFTVQDESSMLIGLIAGIKEKDYIIDVCGAPGGKALHGAELLKGTGMLETRDVTDYKVSLIQENIERMGFHNIRTVKWDARIKDEDSISKADIVIADLPCSGLGVIGKKPDIKYNMTLEKQGELVKLQREILSVVSSYVKEGGTLIYSTCTVNRDENLGNVEWFMENHPFCLQSLEDYLPQKLSGETKEKGYLQLVPGIHDTDGFFMARLKRNIGSKAGYSGKRFHE
ncbi:16S rRNA (cytosine(967)-C(5))-methyltransferase RsmB [Anaerocolumna xylanovorans]|uniref:16S rRNA (cytosine(967)-C(5))-methyltransferase n=1 Tax=Anaerocolumna xylanovorans DSM 12503 TaxID=1121345 RepID=A0A1M7YBH7_9FIRM|nr:16S rRNA (cytosine(967)-C(5))-methyltransferase RsmB [Anaerocolumna xylanovorans]SHO49985.1 16S rRNA (cytosine967-C5)-methyltransferase [Anaerocolumna xylanovorans DSM 12503]